MDPLIRQLRSCEYGSSHCGRSGDPNARVVIHRGAVSLSPISRRRKPRELCLLHAESYNRAPASSRLRFPLSAYLSEIYRASMHVPVQYLRRTAVYTWENYIDVLAGWLSISYYYGNDIMPNISYSSERTCHDDPLLRFGLPKADKWNLKIMPETVRREISALSKIICTLSPGYPPSGALLISLATPR